MSRGIVRRIATTFGTLAGVLLFVVLLAIMTSRVSLVVLAVASGPFLLLAALRSSQSRRPTALGLCLAAIVLAALPADLAFERTGHIGVRVVRQLWGRPGVRSLERATAGEIELAGCLAPVSPPALVVRVSW